MSRPDIVATLGAGRMGRSIAIVFAYAGYPVRIIDAKERSEGEERCAAPRGRGETEDACQLALRHCWRHRTPSGARSARASPSCRAGRPSAALAEADLVFEGVPEVLEAKARVPRFRQPAHARGRGISPRRPRPCWSTISRRIRPRPERFLNAHWLNPAFVMPLVELSRERDQRRVVERALKRFSRRWARCRWSAPPRPASSSRASRRWR